MVKQVPDFSSEDEERAFWATHDSADYLDWSRAKPAVLSRLKPSTNDDFAAPAGVHAQRAAAARQQAGCTLSVADQDHPAGTHRPGVAPARCFVGKNTTHQGPQTPTSPFACKIAIRASP